eukprot:UN03758
MKKHVLTCEYEEITCSFHGCDKTYLRQDEKSHQKNCKYANARILVRISCGDESRLKNCSSTDPKYTLSYIYSWARNIFEYQDIELRDKRNKTFKDTNKHIASLFRVAASFRVIKKRVKRIPLIEDRIPLEPVTSDYRRSFAQKTKIPNQQTSHHRPKTADQSIKNNFIPPTITYLDRQRLRLTKRMATTSNFI